MPELRLRSRPSNASASASASASETSPTTTPSTTLDDHHPPSLPSSTTSSIRTKPRPKSLNTSKRRKSTPTTVRHTSRTPRSPFGAWTGSPKTPLLPAFSRQASVHVQVLLGLTIVLLLGFLGIAWADVHGWEVPFLVIGRKRGRLPKEPLPQAFIPAAIRQEEEWNGRKQGTGHLVPSFPPISLAVHDDPSFQDPGEVGHEVWERMLPRDYNGVVVQQPRRYGLPRSKRLQEGKEAEVFEVAVVRELECLMEIRSMLEDVFDGKDAVDEMSGGKRREARRCLDHLRQAILCHADTTLERFGKQHEVGSARRHSPNGEPLDDGPDLDASIGTVRQCRDWHKIKQWLERNSALSIIE